MKYIPYLISFSMTTTLPISDMYILYRCPLTTPKQGPLELRCCPSLQIAEWNGEGGRESRAHDGATRQFCQVTALLIRGGEAKYVCTALAKKTSASLRELALAQ